MGTLTLARHRKVLRNGFNAKSQGRKERVRITHCGLALVLSFRAKPFQQLLRISFHAEQVLFPTNEKLAVNRSGCSINAFSDRVHANDFKFFRVFDNNRRATAAGQINMAVGDNR